MESAVLVRLGRDLSLADSLYFWANTFAALTRSTGAQALYDRNRSAGDTYHQALRAVANRLIGILHGCIEKGTLCL
jgi:hypothetical protein